MQELIKRFIDCNVPTQVCNLKCPYCYVGQVDGFSGKIKTINHSPSEVRAALSKKRMGGTILINFCGTGETLLGDEILPIVHEILREGHFVQIVTNGTISKRFDEIVTWEKNLLNRLMIKFSYHYSEFVRLNLLDVFFDNVNKVHAAGCSVSVEITSGDNMIEYIEDMKNACIERTGAMPHVTVARDNASPNMKLLTQYDSMEYSELWKDYKSELFETKMKLYGEKRTEFCYGGEWTFYLYLSSGELKQCYKGDVIDNIYEDINRPIRFKPIGKGCREPYCFNGHAWMTLGCIPNMDIATYADVRNRVTHEGKEWLTKETKEFLSHKLEENNVVYENYSEIPKILFFGDSISKGYRRYVYEKMIGKSDVYYPDNITTFSTQLLRYAQEYANNMKIGSNIDMVYFNAGLWDVLRINGDEPLVSISEYERNMERIVNRLRYVFPNAKLVYATTTPVREDLATYDFNRCNADIEKYNDVACSVMNNNGVEIHDLNKYVKDNLKEEYIDFTHFSEKGYKLLSDEIVNYINPILKNHRGYGSNKIYKIIDNEVKSDINALSNKRVIIYGAGDYGERTMEQFNKINLKPYVVCDRDERKQGQSLCGVSIVSPEEYINNLMATDEDIVVIAIKNPFAITSVLKTFGNINGLDICTYKIFTELCE